MIRKLTSSILCLALCLACLPAWAEGVSAVDMMGREIVLTEPATRVVALTAADCEILWAIGAGDCLVGRGSYCDYPEAVLELPAVNSGAETNIEEIIALNPQVVLMSIMSQTKDQVAALEQAGITVVTSDAQDVAGVYEAIALIGALTDKDEAAAELSAQMEAAFEEVRQGGLVNSGKTVYFEVSPLEYGLWTAGSGTFLNELAEMCGLTNIFADVDGWAPVSEEQVIERNPDYIVTITMPSEEGPTPEEEIKARTGWAEIKALKNDGVFRADNDEISRPGPRLANEAKNLLALVAGESVDSAA